MAGNQDMPRLDLAKEGHKLTQVQLDYMKLIENQNTIRVQKLAKLKRNNRLTGLSLVIGILGIYGYSMFAVKQEKFLDELE